MLQPFILKKKETIPNNCNTHHMIHCWKEGFFEKHSIFIAAATVTGRRIEKNEEEEKQGTSENKQTIHMSNHSISYIRA